MKPGYNVPAKVVKKAKTLPEVVEDIGKVAAEWGGVTESIRRLDKDGRIREMDVTIKFKAV
jgi:hypothetical protein